jgi:transposase
MCNRINLAAVKEAGYEYIVGSSIRKQNGEIKKEILNEEGYRTLIKDESNFKFKEVAVNGERLIVSWSADRARKDAYDRETLVEKAKEVLDGKSKLRKPGKAKYLKLEEEVKYLDEAKIFSDSQWDGFYGILTNVEKDLKSDEEIYDAYHQLWKIEECFRTLKSHLKIRPVYLRKPERIQGHLVLCFLTFVFERHLEIELKKQSKWTTPDRLRSAISDLQASLVEINQKQYLLRSEIDPHAKTILELLKIPTPQDLTLLSEF